MEIKDSSKYFCQLIDYTYHKKYTLLALKKYDGHLGDYIKSKGNKLEAREALKIFNLILKAVREMHNKNIFHRDLKLGNVFYYSPRGEFSIVVGDFGLSEDECSAGQGGPRTIGIGPLEVEDTKQEHDFAQRDSWGCTIMLYKMLNGQHSHPFNIKGDEQEEDRK